jgi:hypothetical protein
MNKKEGQCFDCYGNAMFQYFGQTSDFSERKIQLDYVKKLSKPSTIVECSSCERTLEYEEKDGKWSTVIIK